MEQIGTSILGWRPFWTLDWADNESIITTICMDAQRTLVLAWELKTANDAAGWPNESPDDVAGVHHRNCTYPS